MQVLKDQDRIGALCIKIQQSWCKIRELISTGTDDWQRKTAEKIPDGWQVCETSHAD